MVHYKPDEIKWDQEQSPTNIPKSQVRVRQKGILQYTYEPMVQSYKYLGITLDNRVNILIHVNNL